MAEMLGQLRYHPEWWYYFAGLADKVREGIHDGSVRADADPEAMAVSLVGLLRGIALQLISTPPPARIKAIIDEAERNAIRQNGRR